MIQWTEQALVKGPRDEIGVSFDTPHIFRVYREEGIPGYAWCGGVWRIEVIRSDGREPNRDRHEGLYYFLNVSAAKRHIEIRMEEIQ